MFLPQKGIRLPGVMVAVTILLAGCAGIPVKHATARVRPENVLILLYHHIADLPAMASRAQKRWTLSPRKFEAHLEWIASHGFSPITMAQLIAHLKHGVPLPPKPIVISFDDGWKDQYPTAYQSLKKHNFLATFFIVTDSVGHSAFMNWEQLQEMSAAGMDIQPHSLTHPRLTELEGHDLRREIVESKKILENRLNKQVAVFSYPFGSYNDTVIAMVKSAGFEGAVSVSGFNGGYLFRNDQSYTLVRYPVESDVNLGEIARLKGFDY